MAAKQIVILGAGYAGLRLALRLDALLPPGGAQRLVIVDRNPYHQLVVLLHQAAAASIPLAAAAVPIPPLLADRPIQFMAAAVLGLDFARRAVHTERGELPYDILAIALGSEPACSDIPGLRERALTLNSIADARRLRRHVGDIFDRLPHGDPAAIKRALTFVIGGAGYTGTELAGELADWARALAYRSGLPAGTAHLYLVEAQRRIMPGSDRRLALRAAQLLRRKGVQLILGDPVAAVGDQGVRLRSGRFLPTATFVWAGGVRPPALVTTSGLPVGFHGRIRVDRYLQAVGFPGVYVLGDCALVRDPRTGEPCPPSAQLAVQQAEHTAKNLAAALAGQPRRPYYPHRSAETLSLGPCDAVARIGPLVFNGFPARALRTFATERHLDALGGLSLLQRVDHF